jgi:hypothetical protein
MSFTKNVKGFSGLKAKGRKVVEDSERSRLRKAAAHYKALFRAEKHDIAP